MANPSYEEVCTGTTGHAECLQIFYDPEVLSYDELLEVFWESHDPTQLNRQGNDMVRSIAAPSSIIPGSNGKRPGITRRSSTKKALTQIPS